MKWLLFACPNYRSFITQAQQEALKAAHVDTVQAVIHDMIGRIEGNLGTQDSHKELSRAR